METWALNTTDIAPSNSKAALLKDLHTLREAPRFTQLVWKNSTQIGCGRTLCGGQNGVQGWLLVCEFAPKGNVPGQFEENVQGVVGPSIPISGQIVPTPTPQGQIGAQAATKGRPEVGAIGTGAASQGGQILDRMQFWGVMSLVAMVFAALLM